MGWDEDRMWDMEALTGPFPKSETARFGFFCARGQLLNDNFQFLFFRSLAEVFNPRKNLNEVPTKPPKHETKPPDLQLFEASHLKDF
jgi:hypothetical protein